MLHVFNFVSSFSGSETKARGNPRRARTQEKTQVVKRLTAHVVRSGLVSSSVCVC